MRIHSLAPLAARRLLPALLGATLLLALAGCGSNNQGDLAIIGTYTDAYGGTHTITQTTWTTTGTGYTDVFNILEYSNGLMFLLAQNDASNSYNANLYSRFSWTTKSSQLYYCQDPYDATSAAAAREATWEDDTDPASKGCGKSAGNDFAWTALTKQ